MKEIQRSIKEKPGRVVCIEVYKPEEYVLCKYRGL
jgi:hypothetical protein